MRSDPRKCKGLCRRAGRKVVWKNRLSSGLELTLRERRKDGEGAFFDRYEKQTRDMGAYFHKGIKDGKPSIRYKPADDLYMVIKPEVDAAKIHDGPNASDILFKHGAYYHFFMACVALSALLAFTLLLSPIVWMDITGTDVNFFNQTNATSGISSSIKSFTSVSFITFLVPASIAWTNALIMLNPSMRRLQWDTMKWRIMVTLGLNGAYTVASATMFPHIVHGLYLYCRMTALGVCIFLILCWRI